MKIKALIMDVDGTLTDGRVYIGSEGEMFKAFDIKDGYAIKHILPEIGCIPAIITGRVSKAVEIRAAELGIKHIYQGISDKLGLLDKICAELGFLPEEAAYIGDDLNDLEILKAVGLAVCPADAVDEIREISRYICRNNGGRGAVREFCDLLKHNGGSFVRD